MLYVFIPLFAVLLAQNLAICRTILYPPALLCSVWLASLFGLLLSGTHFFSISLESHMVFLVGAVAFSIGGLLAILVDGNFSQWRYSNGEARRRFVSRALDISLVVVLVGLPFHLRAMMDLAGSDDLTVFFSRVRIELVESSGESGFNILPNVVVLSNYLALAAWYEANAGRWSRWRAYTCSGVALVYGVLTGAKSAPVLLLMTLFFVSAMREGRLGLKAMATVVGLSIAFFSAGLLVVNLVLVDFGGIGDVLGALVRGVQNYWLGGMVGFDQIVADPKGLESNQSINRFFLQTANSFGASIPVPPIHAEFTDITPVTRDTLFYNTNVYTIYFSYFKDFAWPGTVLLMALLGLVVTAIFRQAQRSNPVALLLFGLMGTGTVMTVYSETFWIGLNGYIKAFLYFAFLYYFPLVKRRVAGQETA